MRGEAVRLPDQQILDFVLTETKAGKKEWVLQAERAKVFDPSNQIHLDTLVVDFYDERGQHTSRLTSLGGVINRTTHNMEAFGEVLIVTDEGLELESDEVRWVNKLSQIVSDAPVTFTRRGNVLRGVGFVSDASLENIEIRREVRADVRDTETLGREEDAEP